MNIILKKLSIRNFKGIKVLDIKFGEATHIMGANGTGKTTIFDAFTFLLFSKDSTDRKDFEIKPLDSEGSKKDRTENEVSAVLEVDGETISLRHVMKEKWVKKRGEETAEFTGNEHLYFWNDVPMQAGEYQNKVTDILPENVFKLITNPLYFNSVKWQDRRAILQDIAGEVKDEDIAALNPEFVKLLDQVSGKSFKEFRAKNSAEKKKLKDELALIPARIDEQDRSKPEEGNEAEIQAEIARLQAEYDGLDKQIEDRNEHVRAEHEQLKALMEKKHRLETINQEIHAKANQDYNTEVIASGGAEKELRGKISRQEATVTDIEVSLDRQRKQLESLESSHNGKLSRIDRDQAEIDEKIGGFRKLFEGVNAKEIDPDSLVCGECGREHEAHNIDEIRTKFNANKMRELAYIKEQGDKLKGDKAKLDDDREAALAEYQSLKEAITKSIEKLDWQLSTEKATLSQLHLELEAVKSDKVVVAPVAERLTSNRDYHNNLAEIAKLDDAMKNRQQVDVSDLRVQKGVINGHLDEAKRKLNFRAQIEMANRRIEDLKAQEKTMSQQLAEIERLEFIAESFEKAKSEELEKRVNGMFKYARFKLFNQLINGGEEPTCVTTYQGVPFPDLNNAAKILVGIDIINTLSEFHGVTAPVFLDNRESVSNIPDTAAQVINLIVSPEDKELRVA